MSVGSILGSPGRFQEKEAGRQKGWEGPTNVAEESFRSYADGILTVPGKGERPDSCGDWFPTEFCDECGELELSRSACWCRDCPKCWFRWASDGARRITARINSARQAEPDNYRRRAHHVVVSPPQKSIKTLNSFYRAQKEGYELAKEHGIRGGVCIPHAYRATHEAKQRWAKIKDGFDGGIWKWIREHEQDWEELVQWAPHFHILGLGKDLEPGDSNEEWVFKQIRSLSPHRLTQTEGYDDLFGCACYLLSHTSYDPGDSKQSVRWFGELSPSTFSPEQALSKGTYEIVTRKTREIVSNDTETVEDSEDSSADVCQRDECQGQLLPILDAGVRLTQEDWTEELDPVRRSRLRAGFRWANGDIDPPPKDILEGSEQEVYSFLAMVGG